MPRILKICLLVTGLTAALVMMMPWLVFIGLMVFLLPGVVLGAMPTAFFYGACFALGWLCARRLGSRVAGAVGTAFVLSAALGLPALENSDVAGRMAALRSGDRAPEVRADLSGTVRLERDGLALDRAHLLASIKNKELRPAEVYTCDDLCAAALFTPGVSAVVLTTAVPERAGKRASETVYRLARRPDGAAACPDTLLPMDAGSYGALPDWPERKAMRTAWRLSLAGGLCISRDPPDATPPEPDWTLRFETGGDPNHNSGDWRLRPRIEFKRLALSHRKGLVLRRTAVTGNRLTAVLLMIPKSTFDSFGWSRRMFSEGAYDQTDVLGRSTNLALTPTAATIEAPDPATLRATLAAALADPATPADSPAFGLIGRFLKGLASSGERSEIRPGDADLVALLIADPRIRDVPGTFWMAVRGLGPNAAALRAPMVRRVLSAHYPEDGPVSGIIGLTLSALPDGIFALPTPDETRLLADVQRRRWATGLILRQVDRGAAAAPDLVALIADAYAQPEPKNGDEPNRLDDANAAVWALCRLGPEASGIMPRLEALLDAGGLPRKVLKTPDWQIMLARLGKPVDDLLDPEASFRDRAAWGVRLRSQLAHFKPGYCHS